MARPIGLQVLQHLSQSAEIQVCLPSWELGRTSQAVIKWLFGLLQTMLISCSRQYKVVHVIYIAPK
jgi:predicted transcriptional regulator